MDYEFKKIRADLPSVNTLCTVIDSLVVARRLFPGKKNSLDALCGRYEIDNSKRTLHGALLDAQILADVYLAMTGGQTSLAFALESEEKTQDPLAEAQRVVHKAHALKVIYASEAERLAHEHRLDVVEKKGGRCLWRV